MSSTSAHCELDDEEAFAATWWLGIKCSSRTGRRRCISQPVQKLDQGPQSKLASLHPDHRRSSNSFVINRALASLGWGRTLF